MSEKQLKSDVPEDPYREYLRLQIFKRDLLAAFDELISNSEVKGYRWLNGNRDNAEVIYLRALRMAVDRCKYYINPEIILSLQQLKAIQNNFTARDEVSLSEQLRKKLPQHIQDMLPGMTPQEVVEAMKPSGPTGWEIITALKTLWPQMKNYQAGAYAHGLEPDDINTRKAAENFYQREKKKEESRKGKKRE